MTPMFHHRMPWEAAAKNVCGHTGSAVLPLMTRFVVILLGRLWLLAHCWGE
ncbi:MAG TPA: hypothetical protein VEU96_19175 [Bryobacteraceae bacterium]|nr:hypothetical protein [Bryobacteraceae bacterium]